MKTVLITGSSGYIATNFIKKFKNKYQFVLLSQHKNSQHLTFDELCTNNELIASIDVILNLAGANIADKRWSTPRKKEILTSRIDTTNRIVELFNRYDRKPHLISASAVGIYNTDGDINDEDTNIDYDLYRSFSEEITKKWEIAARNYQGILSIMRFGVVLSRSGGAFPKMLKPFLLGFGGRLGDGGQYMPWIALPDLLSALDYVITTGNSGIYNCVAPNINTNYDFAIAISSIWRRPHVFSMPKLLIRLLFGQMGQELFLNSIKVNPKRLMSENFDFRYKELNSLLKDIKNGVT